MNCMLWQAIVEAWTSAVCKVLWQGSLIIGMVWAVCRLWRRMPPFFGNWLWRLVYLKLLIAIVWTVPLRVPIPESTLPTPASAVNYAPPIVKHMIESTGRVVKTAIVPGKPADDRIHSGKHSTPLNWPSVLMLFWLAGVMLQGWRIVGEWRRIRALLSECRPVEDERLLSDISSLCGRLGIRHIPGVMNHSTEGPMLLGLLHPVVVLPEQVVSRMDRDELQPVLAHELAHLKRGDLLWSLVTSLACGLLFFHPLIGILQREFTISQEMACDAMAIEALAGKPEHYSGALLSAIRHCVSGRQTIATAGIGESYSALEKRLTVIGGGVRSSGRVKVILAIVLVGLAICGLVPWMIGSRAKNNTMMPNVRGSIHIVYQSTHSQPALPKKWLDDRIARTHSELLEQNEGKWTKGLESTEQQFMADWKARYTAGADEVSKAEYWGTSADAMWLYHRFSHQYFASYNGEYTVMGTPDAIRLWPDRNKPLPGCYLEIESTTDHFDSEVPFLGFAQPGMSFFSANNKLTKTASGWEERSVPERFVCRYDSSKRPVSVEVLYRGRAYARYEFNDYASFKGFSYPRRVIHTVFCHPESGKPFVLEATEYKALSIDNRSSRNVFNAEWPRKGVYVQDRRSEYTKDPSGGLCYTYNNTKYSVSQTSAMNAAKKLVKQ